MPVELLKNSVPIYGVYPVKLVILRDLVPQITDIASSEIIVLKKAQVAVRFDVAQQNWNAGAHGL
jgi:hypothetical protein